MLAICPVRRMVPSIPEATPYRFLGTELITALVLGEEKSAKPIPNKAKLAIIRNNGVSGLSNTSASKATAFNNMPNEATNCGSTLSEILPAKGDRRVIIKGWASKIVPAV